MEFHGSNAALGAETVVLTDRRTAEPLIQPSEEHPPFPCGLGGLVPIHTVKANGTETLTYVFPYGEGVLEPDDQYEDDVPRVSVEPDQQPVLDALLGAVDLVNGLLVKASELSGYAFGQVFSIQVGVTETGVGFTRVDPFPADRDKAQAEVALTLRIETTDQIPGTTESFSAVVDYDCEGAVIRVAMLEYTGDGHVFRAAANFDEEGDLSIHKVERIDRTAHREMLIYKRGRDDRERGGRGGRPGRAPRGARPERGGRYERTPREERGRYDRGPRGDRPERGERPGRYDRPGRDDNRGGRDDRGPRR